MKYLTGSHRVERTVPPSWAGTRQPMEMPGKLEAWNISCHFQVLFALLCLATFAEHLISVSMWATGCMGGEECILCKVDKFSTVLDPLMPLKFLQHLLLLSSSVVLTHWALLFLSCRHLTELLENEKIIANYLAFSKTLQQNSIINNLQVYHLKAWKLHLLEITGTHFTPSHARKGSIKCLPSWS